ncbi:hypothetical protein [Actinomadura decatromicini]|uniref:DUF8094 domain-containing protein n=1 Tax=Actinomadura decatromicini TaxID=2604572 RepID=A0A5D3FZH4_9ACTN|nr:hypothetical protein [Actinomadura decatromicini]TYK53442.1 hypothetical protein FXF68_07035 [Actinomadura decatromicini]
MAARTATTASVTSSLLVAAALSAGCSGGGNNTSSAEQGEPAGTPALSRAQAEQVLASYSDRANQAARRFNGTALSTIEADPQLSMDVAALKFRRAARQRAPKVEFTPTAYYIPRLTGYPHWFASAVVSGKGKQTLQYAMLFTQAREGAPWLLAAAPYSGEDVLNRVALAPDGTATPVRPDADGLAVPPERLPRAHAALLTEGPRASGAALLADGAKTSETYKALQQGEKTLAGRGVTLSSRFSTTPYGVYALRTKDRGALVWYVLKQNEAYSSSKPGALTVGGDLLGLAPARAATTRMDTTVLVQYLATVPPKGRAAVAAMYRKAVAVHGS